MGMSTHGHQQLSEHHAGHAGSHADAKVRYTMLAVLLVVAELLTASAFESGGETYHLYVSARAIAARRNRQRVDEAASDHCGRGVVPKFPFQRWTSQPYRVQTRSGEPIGHARTTRTAHRHTAHAGTDGRCHTDHLG